MPHAAFLIAPAAPLHRRGCRGQRRARRRHPRAQAAARISASPISGETPAALARAAPGTRRAASASARRSRARSTASLLMRSAKPASGTWRVTTASAAREIGIAAFACRARAPARAPRRSASSALRSSITWKCGATPASMGKRRSSDWQKAWMVVDAHAAGCVEHAGEEPARHRDLIGIGKRADERRRPPPRGRRHRPSPRG